MERTPKKIVQKGRRGLKKALFGRTTVVVFLLLAQLVAMVALFTPTADHAALFYTVLSVVSALVVVHIINRPGDPNIKLTWTVLVLSVPLLGVFFYLFVQLDVGHRLAHKRLEELTKETYRFMPRQGELMERVKKEAPELYALSRYTIKNGGFPLYEHTQVTYYSLGDHMFPALLEEISKAKKFIFLEFFIVSYGSMWDTVRNLLCEKIREGVEVRLLYDGTCALFDLPYHYPEELRRLGIQCKVFSPIRPLVSTYYNNRDHRKIMVIDGTVAFTGGVNLADEYINRKVRFGHWKDAAIRLRGEAVRSFTLMFLQMWNVDQRKEDYRPYLEIKPEIPKDAEGYVLPFGDSPLDGEQVGEMVYMDILNRAERYVHIMTPYLIMDEKLTNAITFAAKRGVEVAILLPHIPDKQYAFALAKTHYRELLSAGVKLYEYTPGFVHSKCFVSDDIRGVVGTINLDYRSLALHFECAAYLYGMEAVEQIETDFQETLLKSKRVTMGEWDRTPLVTQLLGKLLKIFAPLM